jgi:hypothetical protein
MPSHRLIKILVPGSLFFIVDDIRSSCYYAQVPWTTGIGAR